MGDAFINLVESLHFYFSSLTHDEVGVAVFIPVENAGNVLQLLVLFTDVRCAETLVIHETIVGLFNNPIQFQRANRVISLVKFAISRV